MNAIFPEFQSYCFPFRERPPGVPGESTHQGAQSEGSMAKLIVKTPAAHLLWLTCEHRKLASILSMGVWRNNLCAQERWREKSLVTPCVKQLATIIITPTPKLVTSTMTSSQGVYYFWDFIKWQLWPRELKQELKQICVCFIKKYDIWQLFSWTYCWKYKWLHNRQGCLKAHAC